MSAILELFKSLPEIIKLIKHLQKIHAEEAKKKMIKEDIKRINKAFEDRDEKALRDIFNS